MNGLFSWQEPYREFMGKEVYIVVDRIHDTMTIKATVLDPRRSRTRFHVPPKEGYIRVLNERTGRDRAIQVDRILKIWEAER